MVDHRTEIEEDIEVETAADKTSERRYRMLRATATLTFLRIADSETLSSLAISRIDSTFAREGTTTPD